MILQLWPQTSALEYSTGERYQKRPPRSQQTPLLELKSVRGRFSDGPPSLDATLPPSESSSCRVTCLHLQCIDTISYPLFRIILISHGTNKPGASQSCPDTYIPTSYMETPGKSPFSYREVLHTTVATERSLHDRQGAVLRQDRPLYLRQPIRQERTTTNYNTYIASNHLSATTMDFYNRCDLFLFPAGAVAIIAFFLPEQTPI